MLLLDQFWVLALSPDHHARSQVCKRCLCRTSVETEYILSSHVWKCMYYIHLYPNLEITEIFLVDVLNVWNCEWLIEDNNRCSMRVFTCGHEHGSDVHCPMRPHVWIWGRMRLFVHIHFAEVHNQWRTCTAELHKPLFWSHVCHA